MLSRYPFSFWPCPSLALPASEGCLGRQAPLNSNSALVTPPRWDPGPIRTGWLGVHSPAYPRRGKVEQERHSLCSCSLWPVGNADSLRRSESRTLAGTRQLGVGRSVQGLGSSSVGWVPCLGRAPGALSSILASFLHPALIQVSSACLQWCGLRANTLGLQGNPRKFFLTNKVPSN